MTNVTSYAEYLGMKPVPGGPIHPFWLIPMDTRLVGVPTYTIAIDSKEKQHAWEYIGRLKEGHSHVSSIKYHPQYGEHWDAFGAKYRTDLDDVNNPYVKPAPPTPKDGLRLKGLNRFPGFTRLVHPRLWDKVPGEVYQEQHRASDAFLVFPLKSDEQYWAIRNEDGKWEAHPGKYRVPGKRLPSLFEVAHTALTIGFYIKQHHRQRTLFQLAGEVAAIPGYIGTYHQHASPSNCASYVLAEMRAGKLDLPKILDHCPFPNWLRAYIEIKAKSRKQSSDAIYVPGEVTRVMALRAAQLHGMACENPSADIKKSTRINNKIPLMEPAFA
ncbi:MAG TPA: hypothetical protein VFR09_08755 [Alphaproteobacteria bacterium]|nr:hypothetical protein [Alphaproteobacteria bacterium]